MVVWLGLSLFACGGGDDGAGDPDAQGSRGDGGGPGGPGGDYFPPGAWWDEDVSGRPAAGNSDAIIASLRASGGWGNGDRFQIDFGMEVLEVGGGQPAKRTFVPTADFYDPDCDHVGLPVPEGGNLEGEDGYACDNDGDCHLIVVARDERRLYEMWRADIRGDTFRGGCLAVWDTSAVPAPTGRGDQCTSADAAGFPIAPLLFTADEVAAGEIDHAIRFILPNTHVRRGYVRPATHGTDTTGGPNAPSYGVHLRLRADYPVAELPTEGARVVARAADVRHVPRRRRPDRADRGQRPPHDRQVGRPARLARPRRPRRRGLRGDRPRPADHAHLRLRPLRR